MTAVPLVDAQPGDLVHLAGLVDAASMSRGGDPGLVWAEYRSVIENAITNQPRSMQKRIGPSELGTDCLRCLARKLAGQQATQEAAWLPTVGTAVHAWLEEQFMLYNHQAGTTRFLVETRVSVGEVAGVDITGSVDLYDLATAEVTDWKICGATTLRTAKANGPSNTYRKQGHLYGRGLTRRGLPVDRVRIAYLPRNATSLDHAVIWSEPFDEQVALDTLNRANALMKAVNAVGIDALLSTLEAAPGCFDCPRFDPTAPKPGREHQPRTLAGLLAG